MKLQYFREEWKDRPDWITTAEHAVTTMWEEGYKGAPALQIIEPAESSLESSQQIESTSQLTAWQRKRRALQAVETGDVLARFQESGTEDADDVISYWAGKRKDPRWKDLARMALEILSIPAMSTEPERVFSGAKITISDRRCRLGDNIIEALECCKSWEREGLISGVHTEINEMEHMLEALYQESMAKEK
jgi:hypothetical protein